jgi:hypothetical protein
MTLDLKTLPRPLHDVKSGFRKIKGNPKGLACDLRLPVVLCVCVI